MSRTGALMPFPALLLVFLMVPSTSPAASARSEINTIPPSILVSGPCPRDTSTRENIVIAHLSGGRCLMQSKSSLQKNAASPWSLEEAITPKLLALLQGGRVYRIEGGWISEGCLSPSLGGFAGSYWLYGPRSLRKMGQTTPERRRQFYPVHPPRSTHGSIPVILSLIGSPEETERNLRISGIETRWIHQEKSRVEFGVLIRPENRNTFLRLLKNMEGRLILADLQPGASLLNSSSTWRCQSGQADWTPIFDHGLRGEGQTIALMDTGIDPGSCYFSDLEHGLPPINSSVGTTIDPSQRKVLAVDFWWDHDFPDPGPRDWDSMGHGTHTAGTAAGDSDPYGIYNSEDGMAPAARLIIQDGGFQIDPCGDLPGLGCPMQSLIPMLEQAWEQGARIHSDSWGDEEDIKPYNRYTERAADMDRFVRHHPHMLIVAAAGNSGPGIDTVGSPATAKNVVAVGATTAADFEPPCPVSFSSRGWTDDGRIKPDVMAPGSSVLSAGTDRRADTQECFNAVMSGTSMATPTVAGLAALVRQYFAEGWWRHGVADPQAGFDASAALLKATLIASATDLRSMGCSVIDPIPSRDQGWGIVTLDRALSFQGDDHDLLFVEERELSSDSENTYEFHLLKNGRIKVVLVWTDEPSTAVAAPHLVNDLDLILEGAEESFKGNVFSGGESTVGGMADRLNNVEVVLVRNASPGLWRVHVDAHAIPAPPQGFALVILGRIEWQEGSARDTQGWFRP